MKTQGNSKFGLNTKVNDLTLESGKQAQSVLKVEITNQSEL